MRLLGVIVTTFACSLIGCLDTKTDAPAAAMDGGVWGAGAGSVKPPLAQANAGTPWIVQAGVGGAAQRPVQPVQPSAAGSRAPAQAGAKADADGRRELPVLRARAGDAGQTDAGDPDAGTFDAGVHDAGIAEDAASDASVIDAAPEAEPDARPLVEHAGDLIITELMVDPKAIADAAGEWVELYNATDSTLELRDCQLDDGADSLHDIPAVLVEPGAYFTLARDAEPGFSADLVVSLSLTNSMDSVAVVCRGQEIDRVSYDKAAEFAIRSGASLALDPEQFDVYANDSASAWCEGKAAYAMDLGTPGYANPSCSDQDHAAPDEELEPYDAGSPEAHDAGAGWQDAAVYDAGVAY